MRLACAALLAASLLPLPAGAQRTPLQGTPATTLPPTAQPLPPGMQYLYGSGEAVGVSVQAWRALTGYVASAAAHRPGDSVVLDETATLAAPRFVPCGTKPFAVVLDVDETVLLNEGFEYDQAMHPAPYDETLWRAWERTGAGQVRATPGAAAALAQLRALGVTVVFNTNRSTQNALYTGAALSGAGLGPAVPGETLFTATSADRGRKDARRAAIAARYCVLAMAGDQLGDFSDLFNAGLSSAQRRAAASDGPVAARWGAGWFVLPNPVYGTALKGGVDDVFPPDTRWSPPAP